VKQLVQNLRTGHLELLEVPCPQPARGHLLVQTRASLISAGTERMLVEFGRASLVQKARQQPERVKQVLDKIAADGLLPTLEAVFSRLDAPLPLGYCNAGVVVEVGEGVSGIAVGDRVASNGPHAELVQVPRNLVAHIPASVEDEQAAFAVLGAIALQGIRLLEPALGESVAVFGLGLVGLLAVQLLQASGVKVLGIDPHPRRRELARQFGAEAADASADADPVSMARAFSGGQGVDGVLIAASAKRDQIISQSAQMARQRGRIVLVGAVEMQLKRADFYAKELSFQVSCSYGPGRYDPSYEQRGIDYPYPFVRWTEQRNIAAVLELLASRRLDVAALITERIPHAQAPRAYELLTADSTQLGIVLTYGDEAPSLDRVAVRAAAGAPTQASGQVIAGIIGAGGFTQRVLLPALRRTPAVLDSIASAGGVSATHAARKFGLRASTSDYRTILDDGRVNTVFITTRHDLHARLVVESLQAGKHVFVEKPLAIDLAGLACVRRELEARPGQQLLVGFNRRFAPSAVRIRQLLADRTGPACMVMTVNAGAVPADHWIRDPQVGGGRIVGEGCHWIDLLSFLVDARITSVYASSAREPGSLGRDADHVTLSLTFSDGSLGALHYLANGYRTYPKELLTVFCGGRVLELNNFRRLTGYGWRGFRRLSLWRQDKGHQAEIAQFVARVASGGPLLIPPDQLWNVTEIALQAQCGPPGSGGESAAADELDAAFSLAAQGPDV